VLSRPCLCRRIACLFPLPPRQLFLSPFHGCIVHVFLCLLFGNRLSCRIPVWQPFACCRCVLAGLYSTTNVHSVIPGAQSRVCVLFVHHPSHVSGSMQAVMAAFACLERLLAGCICRTCNLIKSKGCTCTYACGSASLVIERPERPPHRLCAQQCAWLTCCRVASSAQQRMVLKEGRGVTWGCASGVLHCCPALLPCALPVVHIPVGMFAFVLLCRSLL
jgi:hypothetical protein